MKSEAVISLPFNFHCKVIAALFFIPYGHPIWGHCPVVHILLQWYEIYYWWIVFLTLLSIQGFHQLIKDWPSDLYDLMTIVNAVKERLQRDPTNPKLMQTLGDLYSCDGRYDKALAIYLK